MKRWPAIAAYNVFTVLALIALAEGAARWLCKGEFEAFFRLEGPGTSTTPFVQEHPELGYTLKPGYRDENYTISENGFRGAADLGAPFLILALGDSTTFGWGVAEGEDYPSRLEAVLHEEGFSSVSVVNAGVPGYASVQSRIQLREILDGGIRPDLMLLSVLWNDIWFSSNARWHPELLRRRPPSTSEKLLRGSSLYRCFQLARFAETGLTNVFNERAFKFYIENLEEALGLARDRGVRLALVDPPFDRERLAPQGLSRFHISYTPDFVESLLIRHLDALDALAGRYDVFVIPHRLNPHHAVETDFFLDPLHPNARGNDVMARDVAAFLVEKRILNSSAAGSHATLSDRGRFANTEMP